MTPGRSLSLSEPVSDPKIASTPRVIPRPKGASIRPSPEENNLDVGVKPTGRGWGFTGEAREGHGDQDP